MGETSGHELLHGHRFGRGSLAGFLVTTAAVALVAIAGWGIKSESSRIDRDIARVETTAKVALDQAARLKDAQAREHTSIEVMQRDLDHITDSVDDLTAMVEILLERGHLSQPRLRGSVYERD